MGAALKCMNNVVSANSLFSGLSLCGKKTYQIRVAGPAQAGKTAIVKRLKFNKYIKCPPTEGLEIDKVDYKDCSLVMWDSRQHFGETVRYNHLDIVAIVYVVDSSDPGRIRIANRTLDKLLKEVNEASVLLVFATKQDKPGALSVDDIREMLMLKNVFDKECGVFACSAKTGKGILDGIDWMYRELSADDNTNICTCGFNKTILNYDLFNNNYFCCQS